MKGWKTVIFNGAIAAIPTIDLVLNNGGLFGAFLGAHGVAVMSFVGLVNVVLRWVTNSPIFKAE